jgi:hypothetical protein
MLLMAEPRSSRVLSGNLYCNLISILAETESISQKSHTDQDKRQRRHSSLNYRDLRKASKLSEVEAKAFCSEVK